MTKKQKLQCEIRDDLDYLFNRINWKMSGLDNRAIKILNTINDKIDKL